MKYAWLLFDADGTLFNYQRAEQYALEASFSSHGLDFHDDTHDSYTGVNNAIWREFERGTISAGTLRAERFRRLFKTSGIDADPEAFSTTYLRYLSRADFLIEGARDLVAGLAQTHQLALVTNGLSDVQRSRFGRSPLTRHFSVVVISEEIGLAKPDRAYFDHVFSLMNTPRKDRVLIIGDSLTSDIQGGINYGIDSCWYNPRRQPCTLAVKPTYEIAALEEIKAIVDG